MNSIKKQMRFYIEGIKSLLYIKYYAPQDFLEELYESYRSNLEKLEEDFPDEIENDSPSLVIGLTINNELIQHKTSMLSIKHTYDEIEAKKWLDKLLAIDKVVISEKLDGLAVSLVYKNGALLYGALRGDGSQGENITHFLIYNKCCPLTIKNLALVEVRGELCGPKDYDRAQLAGAVRQKNLKEPYDNACFYAYELLGANSFYEGLQELSKEFLVVPYAFITEFKKKEIANGALVDSDGWVYRINNNSIAIELGKTSRYYQGRFSFKKSTESKITQLRRIQWKINKSGYLIPVLMIDPVDLGAIQVTKVNGYNKRFLMQNKLGLNSRISISRVGNSAPQIINVVQSSKFKPIKKCLSCNELLEESEIHYICVNHKCLEKNYNKVLYFIQSFKIKGIGINKVIREYQGDFLSTIEHFWGFNWAKDAGDLKIIKYMQRLTISYANLLTALSIPGLSRVSIRDILNERNTSGKKYDNFHQFIKDNSKLLKQLKKTLFMK